MSRPEILFPLYSTLTALPGIGAKTATLFETMQVRRPRDLLFTLPHSGIDRSRIETIAQIETPRMVTVEIETRRHIAPSAKGRPWRVEVDDGTASFQLVFFHAREDWLSRQLPIGAARIVSGKLERFDGIGQIVHPDHILAPEEAQSIPSFEPVYPLVAGITQKLMAKASAAALALAPDLGEWIDPALKSREAWPDWTQALQDAHWPQGPEMLAPTAPARARLAYDELFAHQLTLSLARTARRKRAGRPSVATGRLQSKVLAALPYRPTGAQLRAIEAIADDMAAPQRMNRLLQGDVGSGKTLVAFMALLAAAEAGGQGAMMAPTEILARQHLESLQPLAEQAGVVLELLTGRDKGSERAAKLAAIASGDIRILVGTHAVFQKDVQFNDLRLVIIDEQHRFGVGQRLELGAKGAASDILVMTATPIPRSLALAQYGDMDLSILDEKPPGRQPIQTALLPLDRIPDVTERLRGAVRQGRQAYWVCPLVEESEVSALTSAQERFTRLRAALGEDSVGLLHGQMLPAEKDAVMAKFVSGALSVLVATTVIEVGVNVPAATIMVIEHAESFGLSQLHQLRGRVGRGSDASTCLLLYAPPLGETGRKRLEIMRETEDGFRIAEADLEIRGAGDLIGHAQSGLPRFRIADLERQAGLMATAQRDARALLETDPGLQTPRGQAARHLLWLMEQDEAIRLISVG
ncbi:ATP-dependent DNA helicase RecG [Profundibacterium mesophilum]|uniref:Heme peroxidase n=1 Tax=Profundibacterium mesophilum KAUST100406-0324 TaxID=1037889 RepID=A0A921TEA3_9RHOB|nr:ATP-dependent DNA helicase RecG [Profundibacterium mesophilum]KAF0675224.1 heme peroxidase [Profundibacterium mesophilum KAUST100406-0324]